MALRPDRAARPPILLAYGYGRPVQTTNMRVIRDVANLTDEELRAIAGPLAPVKREQPNPTKRYRSPRRHLSGILLLEGGTRSGR